MLQKSDNMMHNLAFPWQTEIPIHMSGQQLAINCNLYVSKEKETT